MLLIFSAKPGTNDLIIPKNFANNHQCRLWRFIVCDKIAHGLTKVCHQRKLLQYLEMSVTFFLVSKFQYFYSRYIFQIFTKYFGLHCYWHFQKVVPLVAVRRALLNSSSKAMVFSVFKKSTRLFTPRADFLAGI